MTKKFHEVNGKKFYYNEKDAQHLTEGVKKGFKTISEREEAVEVAYYECSFMENGTFHVESILID
ncbi:hypothetical protein ACQKJC_24710 [Priestia koreensis]|uniref:hypothetical protein n=1 Tax=Priestia koreensis TaxID=284581 RepID=UPI003D0706AE